MKEGGLVKGKFMKDLQGIILPSWRAMRSTDLIWRKVTPFKAMTGRTAPSSDGLLAEVFWGFPRL